MNAIFNAVSMEEFKRISNVEVAHTAWNIFNSVSLSLSLKMTHLLSLKLTNYPKIYTVRDLGVIPSCSLF